MSTNTEAVSKFGIDPRNMFEFWDWVGGRYSLWSAIGLSIALYLGMDRFEELLDGAHQVDQHFRTAPFEQQHPGDHGPARASGTTTSSAPNPTPSCPTTSTWCTSRPISSRATWKATARASPAQGEWVNYSTGPVIWGQPGTNGQHAFYQLIHQGTKLIPCDFLAAAHSHNPLGDHHPILLSNYLAQTEALMKGKTPDEARAELAAQGYSGAQLEMLVPAKTFPGNRPTNSFLYPKLTPAVLGALIALYEHKIFTQGVIWNINSFDQMGRGAGQAAGEEDSAGADRRGAR